MSGLGVPARLPGRVKRSLTITRIFLAMLLAAALGTAAAAQTVTTNTGIGTQAGTAGKPPAKAPVTPVRVRHDVNSAIGANVPTLPQIALHPTATIGSGTALVGPGGTSSETTGN